MSWIANCKASDRAGKIFKTRSRKGKDQICFKRFSLQTIEPMQLWTIVSVTSAMQKEIIVWNRFLWTLLLLQSFCEYHAMYLIRYKELETKLKLVDGNKNKKKRRLYRCFGHTYMPKIVRQIQKFSDRSVCIAINAIVIRYQGFRQMSNFFRRIGRVRNFRSISQKLKE